MTFLDKIKNFITRPRQSLLFYITKTYNIILDLQKREIPRYNSGFKEFDEIKKYAMERSDINDFLPLIFLESIILKPKLIVELGVRSGSSTFVFERIAKSCNANLISVDLDDCSHVCKWKKWNFVKMDDIIFAKEFKSWCKSKKIKPVIDILFIDTSHEYGHTLKEINSWFKYLAKNCKVFFHDSNVQTFYKRWDGSIGTTQTPRGVTNALKKYLNYDFNEKINFFDVKNGWIIKHYSNCGGLTILAR